MSDYADSSIVPPVLHDVVLRLETIVPSAIRAHAFEHRSSSVASTLKGPQDKKLLTGDHKNRVPNGWLKIKHPESGVYYYHEEKNSCTSSNMINPRIYSLVTQAIDLLHRSSVLQNLLEEQEVDLVVDSRLIDGAMNTTYYCVSHSERRIFWLEDIGHEEVDIPCPSSMCQESEGLRAHCIEAQYWKHCELFPTTFTVTKNVTGDLKDILLQAAADRVVAKFSTSPYGKEDLVYMLDVVKEIEADVREESGHSSWIIAKFMSLYNDGVLRSSYGQRDDYFDIDNTHDIGPYKRSLFMAIIGPFFFKSPDVYAVELHSFHQNFTPARFSNFVHKVDQSIRDSNLLATVLLSTDMGFLAYTNDGKEGGVTAPTPPQILTYVSIICSVGSIITGLAIFKQYRAKGADTPLRAVIVLRRILEEPLGLERLATICSLPYVLLMWSLLSFVAAIIVVFYNRTAIQVRVPVSVALFLVCLCLFFCMYTAGPPSKEDQRLQKRPRGNTTFSYLPKFGPKKGDL